MDDMISRRAAIDAVTTGEHPQRTCVNCGRTANNGGWYADGRTRCPIEEHYALPKGGYCHLWEKRNVTDDDYPERRCTSKAELIQNSKTWQQVKDLPSVQPEIIACGDCKHYICHDRRCGYWNHGVKPLEWCCHAERITDEQIAEW